MLSCQTSPQAFTRPAKTCTWLPPWPTATQGCRASPSAATSSRAIAAQRAVRSGQLRRWGSEGQVGGIAPPEFLGELDPLLSAAVDERECEVLKAVRRLAERCRDDRNLAIRLVGD
jgi:hypothetical protein